MKKLTLICLVAGTWCACSKVDDVAPVSLQSNNISLATVTHKRINLNQGGDKGLYLDGTYFSYNPGDTLVLTGSWSYCSLANFYGTSGNSVVIINSTNGQVKLTDGFSLTNCRYVKILGKGRKGLRYGFRIQQSTNSGVGVTITGRSSNIEVSNVDIYNKTYGYWVKQEASCIDSLQYPNFIINGISIHNGRIAKTNQEGMYLGSTDPNGLRGTTCNGALIYPKPLRLSNIKVYGMNIDSTNRSGIQLSCAQTGTNEIYNNTISNCGYEFNPDGQGSGISLGGYTTAYVHNNKIQNTYTMGISSLGAGVVDIENNTVGSSGTLAGKSVLGMASIMIDTRPTSPADSTTFIIKNNSLGSTTDFNVRVYNTYSTYATRGNVITANGSASISVATGINWNK